MVTIKHCRQNAPPNILGEVIIFVDRHLVTPQKVSAGEQDFKGRGGEFFWITQDTLRARNLKEIPLWELPAGTYERFALVSRISAWVFENGQFLPEKGVFQSQATTWGIFRKETTGTAQLEAPINFYNRSIPISFVDEEGKKSFLFDPIALVYIRPKQK